MKKSKSEQNILLIVTRVKSLIRKLRSFSQVSFQLFVIVINVVHICPADIALRKMQLYVALIVIEFRKNNYFAFNKLFRIFLIR